MKHKLGNMSANAIALTFAFAPSHTGNASKVKRECKPTHTTVQTFVQTLTDTALNVNRSYKVAANLKRNRFGQSTAHAHNIRLNEIKKRRALFGNL